MCGSHDGIDMTLRPNAEKQADDSVLPCLAFKKIDANSGTAE